MDALELLQTWPDFARASAATLLDLPAWRLPLDLEGASATLVRHADDLPDALALALELDGEGQTLLLGDSPLFPDLHLLWAQRAALPRTVLLALVEKECGVVFQALEGATHKMLAVKGLATERPTDDVRVGFTLACAGGEAAFSLARTNALELALGQLRYLDAEHPDMLRRTRPVEALYATYPSAAFAAEELVPGTRVLLPSADAFAPQWACTPPADDAWHLLSAEPAPLTFESFLRDALPPVPPPERLRLVRAGRTLATGSVVPCGSARAFRLER